jgi:transcriptional regulator with XRE-family HTH domain
MTVPELRNYRRDAIVGLLRHRRAHVDPDPASPAFDPVSDRRVAGMRREEVAWAAGISLDYYVKLEQGRMLNPSPSVLRSIMDALQLSDLDRRYLGLLFEEAEPHVVRTTAGDRARARATLDEVAAHFPAATMRHLLDRDLGISLPDAESRRILFPGVAEPPAEVSLVEYMFSARYRRYSHRVYVDWRDKAAEVIGLVHMKLATRVASDTLTATVQRLLDDPAFRRLWTRYVPCENASGSWRVRLVEGGGSAEGGDSRGDGVGTGTVRDLSFLTVTAPDDPEQSLVIYR